jgi:hypothetical protein
MTRGYLVLGAAIVLAAAIGLYMMVGAADDSTVARSDREDQKADQPIVVDPGKNRIPREPARLPDRPAAAASASGAPRVRDHRAGEHAQTGLPSASAPPPASALPPVRSAPDGRQINAQVTADLSRKLRPSLKECAANLAPDVFGKKSRIEGEIVVAIKDHQATITSASLELRDVAEAAQPVLKQCLVRRAVGFTAPAGDEADVDGYPITLSLSWP